MILAKFNKKNAKKEPGQYSISSTEQAWLIKDLFCPKRKRFLAANAQSEHRICPIFVKYICTSFT